ncbi:MAG: glycosyltransferase family 2 protein [Coriobacteriales bacterium]|jgi:glycosyltransferase involved in cell wall biosynthesis|nr:glycosyltransferase family 2 protein [Coriobacteriales bacterium]
MDEPIISFVVPCYNVSEYVDNCVETILEGTREYAGRIEIILVDDGSVEDDTPAKLDAWSAKHPSTIRAIHQENGGHGAAVNTGLSNARGTYFKVVDADDWLDAVSTQKVLECLARFSADEKPVDMVLTNYVYEKVLEGKHTSIRYRKVLPDDRVFTWDEVGRFKPSQNILMHSVIYRTELLRSIGLTLPRHTFYVDNIFVYVPLPYVQTMFYMDVDMYRYYIGREGQSVNEKVMTSRIDQQLAITRIMIDSVDLDDKDMKAPLHAYMVSYMTMMMTICSVFLLLSKRDDALEQRSEIWRYLEERSPVSYGKIRHSILGRGVNLRGRLGRANTIAGYRLARKIFKFN